MDKLTVPKGEAMGHKHVAVVAAMLMLKALDKGGKHDNAKLYPQQSARDRRRNQFRPVQVRRQRGKGNRS